jgi:hypothetical protein
VLAYRNGHDKVEVVPLFRLGVDVAIGGKDWTGALASVIS